MESQRSIGGHPGQSTVHTERRRPRRRAGETAYPDEAHGCSVWSLGRYSAKRDSAGGSRSDISCDDSASHCTRMPAPLSRDNAAGQGHGLASHWRISRCEGTPHREASRCAEPAASRLRASGSPPGGVVTTRGWGGERRVHAALPQSGQDNQEYSSSK